MQETAQQNAVYSHLLTFFSRYYEQGDFISQRRYKGDTYAIPYNGEEVMLHWANKDQYYTKSGENFSNYRFSLADGRQVEFRLIAADTAKDNQKENDKARVFMLAEAQTVTEFDENGDEIIQEITPFSLNKNTLTLYFVYQFAEKSKKQPVYVKEAVEFLQQNANLTDWEAIFELAPTEKEKNRTLLEKYLTDYTTKNSADYFIHKDLNGFLRRELDFYIKNELMNLDNLQSAADFSPIAENLLLIQTFRKIGLEIIAFLSQLENFQKKLWLKKKFVANCHYLITLDKISEIYYPKIVENQKQLTQWKTLFNIEIESLEDLQKQLKNSPHLVLDTSLFSPAFQADILAEISELDENTDGLIIHSDNFQALNLLQTKYKEQVKCIYIDPPYNAKSSEILYKNTFKHSAWITLMDNRIELGKNLLKDNSSQAIAIDEVEQENLGYLIKNNFIGWSKNCIPIVHNPRGQQGKNISYVHEYLFLIYPNDNYKYISDVKRIEVDSRNLRDSGTESDRIDARNCFYPFIIKDNKIIGIGDVPNDDFHPNSSNILKDNGIIEIYPIDDNGNEKKWRYAKQSVNKIIDKLEVKQGRNNLQIIFNKDTGVMRSLWVDPKYDASEYGTKVLQDTLGSELAKGFSYPKSINTVSEIINIQFNNDIGIVLDYFAGSGTTAHATINLNREDNGKRKYILVEQGEYFNTVLKPRIQKVVFAENWKDGKPQADDEKGFNGVSHICKVLKLESYEDTLNNLTLQTPTNEFNFDEQTAQDYLLHYMLDIESRESLLNTQHFNKPFDYELNISTDSAGAYLPQKIDLVETFNYLIGLNVSHIDDQREKRGYVLVEGRLPNNESALIVWRDCEKVGYAEIQVLFDKLSINAKESFYDLIYLNGDHNIPTISSLDDNKEEYSLKLRPIESEFLRLMFDVNE
ncbi:site-specific DNA-methyltransferase [Actinobacillus succinogenes]|uniref:site-specific DNA-methyltransferase n=1 Tax=Actinobacillus succinogenes TaxID=67854 RepID=UPI00359CB98A